MLVPALGALVEIGGKARDVGIVAAEAAAFAPQLLTAPVAFALSLKLSQAAKAASLCGAVTFAPRNPSSPMRARNAGNASAETASRPYAPGSPKARSQ